MNYQIEAKKISVISLAIGKARQRKNILIIGAEQTHHDADDNNRPYAIGKLCIVQSAYVLLTTDVEDVSFPDLSPEMLTLSTLSSAFSFFVFSGDAVVQVSDDRAVLSTKLSVAGTGNSVDSVMLAATSLPSYAVVILVAVMSEEVEVGVVCF